MVCGPNELKFCEDSWFGISWILTKFQLIQTTNKKVLFLKKIDMLLFETVKKLIFWIVTRVSTRDYTVLANSSLKNICNPLWISIHLESTFECLDIVNNKRHFYLSFVMRNFFFFAVLFGVNCVKNAKSVLNSFLISCISNLLIKVMREKFFSIYLPDFSLANISLAIFFAFCQ